MRSVPFEFESGLQKVTGVVREGTEELFIEYETKLLGLIRSGVKVIRIPYQDIQDVACTGNIFSAKLYIQLKTLRNIGSFPAPKQGMLELKVPRKFRQEARSFASGINLAVSRYELGDDWDKEDDFV